jgi:uracil-DNA glycosylase
VNPNSSIKTLVDEVILLAKQQAKGNPPRLVLSKETMALLHSIGEEDVFTQQAGHTLSTQEEEMHAVEIEDDKKEKDLKKALIPERSSPIEKDLTAVAKEVATCKKCPLGELRNNTVPGEGNPNAKLVFVGEAPGADEDRTGRPFVGRAGQLLTDIIVKGMGMTREEVFICNVLKCRPPENRVPNPEEVMYCEPYLLRQLDAIKPMVICALGATAAQTLLKTKTPIKSLRGVWHNYHGIPFRVTYHPAYLLRNPPDKRKTWDDVKEILRVLNGEITPEI